MKSELKSVHVQTQTKREMLNLTSALDEAISASGVRDGIVGIYSQHTTASLFVSEFQPALIDDVAEFLERIVADDLPYKHNCPELSDCERKNAAAHLRSVLLNHSLLLPVAEGKAVLGQFQSVILAELDGPRDRTLQVQILGQ
jgi:secondary thiamine-phosphate synthase enzyme